MGLAHCSVEALLKQLLRLFIVLVELSLDLLLGNLEGDQLNDRDESFSSAVFFTSTASAAALKASSLAKAKIRLASAALFSAISLLATSRAALVERPPTAAKDRFRFSRASISSFSNREMTLACRSRPSISCSTRTMDRHMSSKPLFSKSRGLIDRIDSRVSSK